MKINSTSKKKLLNLKSTILIFLGSCTFFLFGSTNNTFGAAPPQWDSIKTWNWDYNTPTTGWLIGERFYNFVYDANKNLLSGNRDLSSPPSTNITKLTTTNTYDGKNNLLTSETKLFYNNSWVTYVLITQTFDTKDNLTSSLQQQMNNSFTALETQRHIVAMFDINSNRLSYLDSSFQGGEWSIYKINNSYDINNNMTTNVEQNWFIDKWLIVLNWTKTYDNHRNKITQLDSNWSNNGFLQSVLKTKFTNLYDVNNNLLSQHDSATKAKTTYTYDNNNNRLTTTIQGWNGSTLSLVTTYKVDYTYDNKNNLTSQIDSTFNTPYSTVLRSIARVYYTYDAKNNVISELTQRWAGGIVFKNASEKTYTYNPDNNKYIIVNKYFDSTGEKISSGDSTYFYKGVASNINKIQSSNIAVSIFPNPTTDQLNIIGISSIEKVEIYNLSGMFQAAYLNKSTIDISNLSEGIYFVKIYAENGISTQKFIKQ